MRRRHCDEMSEENGEKERGTYRVAMEMSRMKQASTRGRRFMKTL